MFINNKYYRKICNYKIIML